MKSGIFLFIICFLFFSCNGDDMEMPSGSNSQEIHFSVSLSSLKYSSDTETQFDDGDNIGVYAVKRGEKLLAEGNYADNKHFKIAGNSIMPVSDKDRIFKKDGVLLDFYCYYPYDEKMEVPDNYLFSISDNQEDNFGRNDLMRAVNNTWNNNGTVPLLFNHCLATVEVRFKTGEDKSATSAHIAGVIPDAILNMESGIVKTSGIKKQPIRMHKQSVNNGVTVFRSLFPAQVLKKGHLFSLTVDGLQRNYALDKDILLVAGSRTSFDFGLQYRINVSSTSNGSVTGGGIFDYGKDITVSAIAQKGYAFEGWYEKGIRISTATNYSFTVNTDRSLEARFIKNTFTITVKYGKQVDMQGKADNITGLKSSYNYGETATLTAKFIGARYNWLGWYDVYEGYFSGKAPLSRNETYSFVVTRDITLYVDYAVMDL